MADAVDVAPELLNKVWYDFIGQVKDNKQLRSLRQAVEDKTATYEQANYYATELSKVMAKSLRKFLTPESLPDGKLYYNIADKILTRVLEGCHLRVANYCYKVQRLAYDEMGVQLDPAEVPVDQERIHGIVWHTTEIEELDQALQFIESASETYELSVVDESVKRNVKRVRNAGMKAHVYRKANPGCCKWCKDLASGSPYEYDGDDSHEYWRRHVGCKCTLKFVADKYGRLEEKTVWDPTMQLKRASQRPTKRRKETRN